MKRTLASLLASVLLLCGAPSAAENLLSNSSFEEYSCNFLGCSFDDWSYPAGSVSANSTDKLDGEVSLLMAPTSITSALDNYAALPDSRYAAGTTFLLKMYFKVKSMPSGGSLMTDCYWEPQGGGDAEAMKAHDADVLQRALPSEVSSEWDSVVIYTTKPARSSNLRVRLKVPKNAQVLFDAFLLEEYIVPTDDPYIEATPATVPAVEVNIGETAVFQTIHVRQGNLSGPTIFRIGGTDAPHFSLSATSLPADQSELDLVVTYAPQAAGTHHASLIFDNAAHTTILPDMISLNGSCVDPTLTPVITVGTVPDFDTVKGKQIKGTISVTSENCTDYIYLRVDHVQGQAFTIASSMLPKNYSTTVDIYFTPSEAGTYQSTLTFSSTGAQSVVVTLNGIAREASPETIDWQTTFVWDDSHPLSILDEPFNETGHNTTLLLEGWQNVAKADARPWYGFDGTAKATSYQYAKDSTDTWSMWLVTPALDYKNAPHQVFGFSVMGEYLADEGNKSTLEVYYIDATDPSNVFMQAFDNLPIPVTSDENNTWIPIELHLEGQSMIADVFHMAFRYTGPNGGDGAIVYYIDNVSWGVLPEGLEEVQKDKVPYTKVLRDGQMIIIRGEKQYTLTGTEIR